MSDSPATPAPARPTRLRDAVYAVPLWGWALLFSVALCLPGLAGFGFWDPWELRLAEQARDVARSGEWFALGSRPLLVTLIALGIKLFGASELGARMFVALSALGALMAVYWAGVGLLRPRAALLATLALGTMPLFALEARQLTSDTPLIAALALALGGLGRAAWPADGRARGRDLAIGLAGVVIGVAAGGALLGYALPLLAIAAALLIAPGARSTAGRGAARAILALAVLAVVVLVIGLVHVAAGKYSLLLGGVGRAGAPSHTFEILVRQLGFGLFPWSAVAVFALARPLVRLDDADRPDGAGSPTDRRLAFAEVYFFLFAGLGFAISSYLDIVVGGVRYVALPAIALAVGAFLDEALDGVQPEPVTGLLMATGTMIVARDFYLAPEDLASLHVVDKVRWPPTLAVGELILVVGLIAAVGVYAGLAVRARVLGKAPAPDLSKARPLRRYVQRLVVDAGRYGLQVAVACAVVFAFYLTHVIVPRLSTHLSFKPVLESYAKFARSGEKIGRYRVEGHGSTFYNQQTLIDLPTQDRVVQFMRDPDRVFAMVSADELASLDAAFKQNGVPYYVVDASSSRFLLITNRLNAGQQDENPLIKNVWMPSPVLHGAGPQPSDKPPWTWRVPVSATFGDAIELIGADFPESVRRPGKVPLDLIFRVKARPPGAYKIFVHLDGPAQPRVIGDHDPVGHAFGTSFWLPGEYVRDHYDVDVPLMTTPAGTYNIFVGFWPGGEGKRLKITAGPNDGADRVRLGTMEIK